jgi:spore germination protein GerM
MRGRRLLPVLAAVITLTACGVPTGGAPSTIPASEVPYGLAAPRSTTPPATSSPARGDRPRIYLIDHDGVLVASGRSVSGDSPQDRLADLLRQLAAGPSGGERDDALTTSLPPGIRLTVTAFDGGTATVDLAGTDQAPTGKQSRRAVGQIVLTATSLPEVHAVRLTRDAQPLEAPLPSGRLTAEPLTADDYGALLVAQPS